ncbi:MAG: DVU0524 family FlgM-associated protein [Desulfobacterales bacterium]
MVISTYQVNNVLRVYKGQLRQGKMATQSDVTANRAPDKINISAEAKRMAVIDKVAGDIYNKITQHGPNGSVEKEVFQKLENQYGGHLAIAKEDANGLLFKEIDERGETVHFLSLEDSKFLSHELKAITKETVDKNMF